MTKDAEVTSLLVGDDTLLDSTLVSFELVSDGKAQTVNLIFKARPSSRFDQVKLHFVNVVETQIYCDENSMPMDVWEIKFLRLPDDSFYISLDPDPATLASAGEKELRPVNTDKFLVRSLHIEAEMR